eukprot:scaffold10631_cov98-Isochrysis_galbana.AAC.1
MPASKTKRSKSKQKASRSAKLTAALLPPGLLGPRALPGEKGAPGHAQVSPPTSVSAPSFMPTSDAAEPPAPETANRTRASPPCVTWSLSPQPKTSPVLAGLVRWPRPTCPPAVAQGLAAASQKKPLPYPGARELRPPVRRLSRRRRGTDRNGRRGWGRGARRALGASGVIRRPGKQLVHP